MSLRTGLWPTSKREDTIVNSLPGPVRHLLVIAAAAVLLPVGVVMLVLPGPGLLVIGASVALLAGEFPAVRRLLQRAATIAAAARARLPDRPKGSEMLGNRHI